MNALRPSLAAGAAALLLAAGCGGGASGNNNSVSVGVTGPGGASANAQVIRDNIASSGLAFTKSTLTASAGNVTLVAMNPQSTPHDISIKGNGVNEQGNAVSNGGVSRVSANLKPGTYEFYCSVDSHEAAGMKGTLTVQ